MWSCAQEVAVTIVGDEPPKPQDLKKEIKVQFSHMHACTHARTPLATYNLHNDVE